MTARFWPTTFLVPFDNDSVLTVTSPISVEGQDKVKPRRPPAVGQHSDEVLREAGYDATMIAKTPHGWRGCIVGTLRNYLGDRS